MTRSKTPRQARPANSREERARRPPGRRSYRPPRLECHGRLADVTCFGGSQIVDSGGGLGQQF